MYYSSITYINTVVELLHRLRIVPSLLGLIIEKRVVLSVFVCRVFV